MVDRGLAHVPVRAVRIPIAPPQGRGAALALDVQGACTLASGNVTGMDALP